MKHKIETKNTIIYNRYKDDITLIHNHTNITVEEIIIDKKITYISVLILNLYMKSENRKISET